VAGKHHDLVNHAKKYKGDSHQFFLDLTHWRKFKCKYKLDWQKIRFGESAHKSIPKERGVYVFTVELSPGKLPLHGYILYVGITGDTSNHNLYKRYADYLLYLKNANGRPAIYYMLKNWSDDLFFNFVTLPNKGINLERIEKVFINAVIPPINKRDFDATISAPKAAAF
jgi:hypothetical protein